MSEPETSEHSEALKSIQAVLVDLPRSGRLSRAANNKNLDEAVSRKFSYGTCSVSLGGENVF